MIRSNSKLIIALAIIASQLFGPVFASDEAVVKIAFSKSFGSQSVNEPFVATLGVTALLSDELRDAFGQGYLPISGLLFSRDMGPSPLLLGNRWYARSEALYAQGEEESSHWYNSWGWLAVGAVLVVGTVAVVAGGGRNDSSRNDGGGNPSNNTINIISNGDSNDGCTIINPETQTVITGNCF